MDEPIYCCDSCGREMKRVARCEWHCKKCDKSIFDFSQNYNESSHGTCANCGQSLRGDLTLPREDGDNANAYVRCKHCGYENIKYGYGEDD